MCPLPPQVPHAAPPRAATNLVCAGTHGEGVLHGKPSCLEPEGGLELSNLQLLLVETKIRCAELEYEKEKQKLKARKLQKKLEQLGGSHMETAQTATQLEVRYAQARAEVARLTKQNAQLQADVVALVELKLQLAEAKAALGELAVADAGVWKPPASDSEVEARYMAPAPA